MNETQHAIVPVNEMYCLLVFQSETPSGVLKVILRKRQWRSLFLKRFRIMWSLENLSMWTNFHTAFYQRNACICDKLWSAENILQILPLWFIRQLHAAARRKSLMFYSGAQVFLYVADRTFTSENSVLWLSCKHWDGWICVWCDV